LCSSDHRFAISSWSGTTMMFWNKHLFASKNHRWKATLSHK
jgi:hypothetical protein